MLVEMKEVSKAYTIGETSLTVLQQVNLEIQFGEFIAIMGRSGSGKSSLLYLLGCMDRPSSGSYRFNSVSVSDLPDEDLSSLRNRQIGFIFQTFNLIHQLNVLENVEVPLLYRAVPAGERRKRCLPLIEKVGLSHRLHHTPSQLSGGEMQRVAIARALVNDPLLILADEPTGNLDTATAAEIMGLLSELNSQGRTVVLVTHDSAVASHAKRVLSIQDGHLRA